MVGVQDTTEGIDGGGSDEGFGGQNTTEGIDGGGSDGGLGDQDTVEGLIGEGLGRGFDDKGLVGNLLDKGLGSEDVFPDFDSDVFAIDPWHGSLNNNNNNVVLKRSKGRCAHCGVRFKKAGVSVCIQSLLPKGYMFDDVLSVALCPYCDRHYKNRVVLNLPLEFPYLSKDSMTLMWNELERRLSRKFRKEGI